mmetsp:Transcript_7011/g.9329  ORF Transcript_7011/g.9329 Transcript_7011/m.9329 type:complete len:326 (-) Transcript_7011:398-1375(-)
MNAIGAILTSLTRHHIQVRFNTSKRQKQQQSLLIVHGNELYCDVLRTIRYTAETFPLDAVISKAVDVCYSQVLLDFFQQHGQDIGIFHWEAASNPSSYMLDPNLLPQLRALAQHCIFVCDNTWLSGAAFNPLDYGADVVIESMTKHLSAGTCIGGMIIGRANIFTPLEEYVRIIGIFVDAIRCQVFSEKLRGAHKRIQATSSTALALSAFLQEDQRVVEVFYPLLKNHPSYAVAVQHLKFGPGCVWCRLPVSNNKFLKAMTAVDAPMDFKTSFGGSERMRDELSGKEVPTVWIRLSVGYDEPATATIIKVTALLDRLFGTKNKCC